MILALQPFFFDNDCLSLDESWCSIVLQQFKRTQTFLSCRSRKSELKIYSENEDPKNNPLNLRLTRVLGLEYFVNIPVSN